MLQQKKYDIATRLEIWYLSNPIFFSKPKLHFFIGDGGIKIPSFANENTLTSVLFYSKV